LSAQAGFEYEFFVFRENSASVREKGYRDMRPITPGNFGYSVLRAATNAEIFTGMMDYCADFRMPLEGLHCETGPGVWEAALAIADGMESADRATLFKTFAKVFFSHRDHIATFMAKWSMDYPGQSGHYHFSLLEEGGDSAFAGDGVPDRARWAIGGLLTYVPQFLPLLAPTVNSFTRLVKGAWAPTASTWGIDNRTAAFRFIPGDAGGQHIECRVGGADSNPYLAAAATLGAALLGIEERIEPPEPVTGNAYDAEDGVPPEWRFAPTLREAAGRLAASAAARRLFGDAFVDHYVGTRLWESREAERHVNDWQLGRYFEIV
jgi:glutamine synthetase